ncbi:hypothetical protein MKX03_010680 [Papaver bracteatum]|nr:hypothetical protein MKX03_010680 [Papaver bracteatum]
MAEIQSELNPERCSFSSTRLKKLNQIPVSSFLPPPPYARKSPEAGGIKTKTKLEGPDDILQLLHNYFPWETIEDIDVAELGYYRVLYEERNPKMDDITADLAKLKELSSILKGEYDSCREVFDNGLGEIHD